MNRAARMLGKLQGTKIKGYFKLFTFFYSPRPKGIVFLGNSFITKSIYAIKEVQNQNSRALKDAKIQYLCEQAHLFPCSEL